MGRRSRVTESLPAVAGRSVIDGTTQDGGWVVLDGSGAPADGIRLLGSQSTVRGLVIGGFPGAGVVLGGRGAHEVLGNRIGTTPDGTGAVPNGIGVRVTGGAASTIGGEGLSPAGCGTDCNLISGNTAEGILLEGGSGHRVTGDLIGLALDGSTPLPNHIGVEVRASDVQVGDDTRASGTSPGNVVSGNSFVQIQVAEKGDSARIEGNFVGLDTSGTLSVPGMIGISVLQRILDERTQAGSPDDVVIGGPTTASRNVIRADRVGIGAEGISIARLSIWSNFIGTDVTGRHGLGGDMGVPWGGEDTNGIVLGPPDATEPGGPMSNLISGNAVNVDATTGVVAGNLIGTDITGRNPIIDDSSQLGINCVSASITRVLSNLISGNLAGGVQAEGCLVEGNRIGTDITGTRAVPNSDGIFWEGTFGPEIVGNLISGNQGWGVRAPSRLSGGHVAGNLIGTDITGSKALPNGAGGIRADQGITIGAEPAVACLHASDCPDDGGVDASVEVCVSPCNVIAGNLGPGIALSGEGEEYRTLYVAGNFVGLAADATDLPNAGVPIAIESAPLGAMVVRNRILSTEGPGVLANENALEIFVYGNRTDVRTGETRFARAPIPGSLEPSRPPSAVTVSVPEAPASATGVGRQLTVSGQALYDSDDAVELKVYTARDCAGPERLVATVTPEESTNEYEWVGPRPEDAVVVLLQAVPTAGLRGSSEFSECTRIVDGS